MLVVVVVVDGGDQVTAALVGRGGVRPQLVTRWRWKF
jgi:hypothetical protein